MQNNNNYSSYPNTEFPYNYTINGQKQLREKYLSNFSQNQVENMAYSQNTNTYSNNQSNNQNINTMSSPKFDISKLVPMLFNKNLKTSDLIDMLLPMINNSNLPLKDLLNLNNKVTKEDALPKKSPIISAGYKKVE